MLRAEGCVQRPLDHSFEGSILPLGHFQSVDRNPARAPSTRTEAEVTLTLSADCLLPPLSAACGTFDFSVRKPTHSVESRMLYLNSVIS